MTGFVERPSQEKRKPLLADFWIAEASGSSRGRLVNARFEGDIPRKAPPTVDLWSLDAEMEGQDNQVGLVGVNWHWARRRALLNLELAQPFAVAAKQQGGVHAASRAVLRVLERGSTTLGEVVSKGGGDENTSLRAVFGLVKDGRITIDWTKPLNRLTPLEAAASA